MTTPEFNQTLTPAYGRDYKSQATVYKDLVAGKDFLCQPSGRYIALNELHKLGVRSVWIRYDKRMKKAEFFVPGREAK